ncbi:SitA5 family polymorphic toxin [Myxococcus landrumensis]|uniref:Lipoprotein n=1 Tax=Myxococcus landrumensis TaxID=2813577 RepID=A0ABX7N0M7_9BACT|nr:hypothetical protein [Myxococcus landrumus]QSQ12013.1 hypothetical protein JY572_26975 [Myxococcus landrumus]
MGRGRAVLWCLFWMGMTAGCSTTRVVRLDMGMGEPVLHTPRGVEGPVELDEDSFKTAVGRLARGVRPSAHPLREARHRLGVPERGGMSLYERRRLVPVGEEGDVSRTALHEPTSEHSLTRDYARWCEDEDGEGDCLRLLEGGASLGREGKYALALAFALGDVWEETGDALEDLSAPWAVRATLTASVAMYLMPWSLPEPRSNGLPARMTATAMAYLGVEPLWQVLDGWGVLVRRVDGARTFEELRDAGAAYGEVLGENAARVLVMLSAASAGVSSKGTTLPGAEKAAVALEAQAGCSFRELSSVESVAMTSEGFTLVLPPTALARTGHDAAIRGHPRR